MNIIVLVYEISRVCIMCSNYKRLSRPHNHTLGGIMNNVTEATEKNLHTHTNDYLHNERHQKKSVDNNTAGVIFTDQEVTIVVHC